MHVIVIWLSSFKGKSLMTHTRVPPPFCRTDTCNTSAVTESTKSGKVTHTSVRTDLASGAILQVPNARCEHRKCWASSHLCELSGAPIRIHEGSRRRPFFSYSHLGFSTLTQVGFEPTYAPAGKAAPCSAEPHTAMGCERRTGGKPVRRQ